MSSPYRRPPRAHVEDPRWRLNDVVHTRGARWIIRGLYADGRVELETTSTNRVRWTTTLDRLPAKPTR